MPRRALVLGAAGAAAIAAGALAWFERGGSPTPPERPAAGRPELLLLTGLPIVFAEGFSLEETGSPALAALRGRYEVVPISLADSATLSGHALLLMAQPHAQPAETLVELDRWIREGGHVLVLADPALAWPSERALGDVFRPPLAFADTGLLGHWGLRLDTPDDPGPRAVAVDGLEVRTVAPGKLVATGPACAVDGRGFVARCGVGRGSATVIADADFIGVAHVEGATQAGNLDLLLRELERLEQ